MAQQFPHMQISAANLTISRGGLDVVAGVSFSLTSGESLVLRGANGSGKTSLLRHLAGFSRHRQGTLEITADGNELQPEDALSSLVHYLGHENGLMLRLSVLENINFWQGFLEGEDDNRLEEFGLLPLKHRPAGKLSAGQRRRLALYRLAANPRPLWLMDEPDNALDAGGRKLLQSLCEAHLEHGGMIILCAHGGFAPKNAKTLLLESETA